jgi:FixJ family two-component response regulator
MSQLEARRMGRRSPFVITLTKQDRRKLEARAGRPTAEQRQALHARIVLAAAGGEPNRRIAAGLGVVPNTVCKWRKRFAEQGLAGLADRPRSGRPPRFPRR